MGPKTLSWLIMWSSLASEDAMVHCEVYDTVQLVSLDVSQKITVYNVCYCMGGGGSLD